MILIDSIFINNGGGKVLLDYLVGAIEKTNLDVYYLFDSRCKDSYQEIEVNRKCFVNPTINARLKFYKKNKNKFTKVFCLGNIPPQIKLDAKVFTYFHQALYLDIPNELPILDKLKLKLKIGVLKFSKKNTNVWLVQTDLLKYKLKKKLYISDHDIKVLPFFPQFDNNQVSLVREKKTYLYVSNASPHKNHVRLINVFCKFYEKYRQGKLILTVDESYHSIQGLISEKQNLGFPIENIGFAGRDELKYQYHSCEFLIFPSLTESFGLGLIEGIQCGCKVIAADLPYTFEVCYPSLKFNPLDDASLFLAFENSINQSLQVSVPKIYDRINDLISYLD